MGQVSPNSSYRALLAAPGVARLVPAMVLARLPLGATTMLLVLCVSARYGSLLSGAASGALTLGTALCAPVLGRGVDRGRGPALLRWTGFAQAALVLALIAAVELALPAALIVAIAFAAGCLTPPVAGTTRSLWGCLVPAGLLDIAYNFEVLLVDVLYVTGPLLASAFIAVGAPAAGLAVVMVGQLAGSFWLAASAPVRRYAELGARRVASDGGDAPHGSGAGARDAGRPLVRDGAIILMLAACLLTNAFSGAFETLLPLWFSHLGEPGGSGALISIWSIGSIIGVLLFARFQPSKSRISLPGQLVLFTLVYCAAASTCALHAVAPLLTAGAFLIGVAVSPCTNLHYQLGGALAPRERHAEMFSWINTATSAGISLGAFAVGAIVDAAGFDVAFPCLPLFILAAAGFAVALRARGRAAA